MGGQAHRYGATNAAVRSRRHALGKHQVLWNVDPQDWARPGSATIARRIVGSVRSGSIVLMHDGGGNRSQTVAALASVLSQLRAKGYPFRSLHWLCG